MKTKCIKNENGFCYWLKWIYLSGLWRSTDTVAWAVVRCSVQQIGSGKTLPRISHLGSKSRCMLPISVWTVISVFIKSFMCWRPTLDSNYSFQD